MSFKYDTEYDQYERNMRAMDSYRIRKSQSLIQNEKPGKILDIGCLAGGEMVELIEKGFDCYGIEKSEAYKKAIERGVKCVHHDLMHGIPFPNGYFDILWAEEIIEHLSDTDYFLDECWRVTRNGGILIISTPNIASLINRFKILLGRYPRYLQYSSEGPGHVRYYTMEILERQLNVHRFEIERIVGNFLSFPDPTQTKLLRRYVLSRLGDLLPTLSENLIVKARRLPARD